jgi:hypothetical protein
VFNWISTKLYPAIGLDGGPTGEKVVPFVDGVSKCVFAGKGLGTGDDWWVSGGKKKRDVQEGTHKADFEVWSRRE